MAGRNSPDHVNSLTGTVVLQHQDARTFRIGGIVFHDDGCVQSINNIARPNGVCRELVVTVKRHAYFATSHQRSDLLQRVAHGWMRASDEAVGVAGRTVLAPGDRLLDLAAHQ